MNSIEAELAEIAGELNEDTFGIPKGVKVHECNAGYARAMHGIESGSEAIFGVMSYDDKTRRWWISNGIQSSAIFFCPYCGLDLKTLFASAG